MYVCMYVCIIYLFIQVKQENHLLYSGPWNLQSEPEKRCNRAAAQGSGCRKQSLAPLALGAVRAVRRHRQRPWAGGRGQASRPLAPAGLRWRQKRAGESLATARGPSYSSSLSGVLGSRGHLAAPRGSASGLSCGSPSGPSPSRSSSSKDEPLAPDSL